MAEQESTSKKARAAGPELRLLDRRAFVGFPELVLSPGVVVHDFALQIPDVSFPLNVSGGAAKYQKKKLDFGFLELSIDADVLHRAVTALAGKVAELGELKLHFRPNVIEVQARLAGPERTPVTFKVAFDGDGDALAVYLYDVRLYAFSPTPAARIPALVSEAVESLALLPDVERRGANGFTARILPELVKQAAVSRGFKMPSLDQARLAEAQVTSKGLRLRFTAGGLPPPAAPDEELLLALEGARAFADAEELVAQGKLKAAREAYLRLGDATEAHPFAVERLLTLLVADPQAHELALDIAASLARRRDKSATAIWAEAVVRERRGEFARAAERYLALCTLARRNQEEAGAFFAAEAAARSSRDHAPQMAVKALHELLGLKPDHLPSLKSLARASDQAKDRAGAIRAYRRLAALARDPAEAADAHVQLARLCASTEDDIAGARLHCEAALRLSPDNPDALLQLGDLCFRSGEHLRAVKALDRLREVAMGRHEVDRVGRANLLAGRVWELGLKQNENALLRYREAASMLPGEAEPVFLGARVADALGRIQEAVAGYQQAIELAGPAPRDEDVRASAHAAHHALAKLLKAKLGEPARAREHLEAALALDATDTTALDELLPYFRASGKAAELADACEKAAAVIEDPPRRAALWAEAGELYRGRLAQPEKAERLLSQALDADPKNRLALEGMLALAEARRDGGQLTRCLRALAELAEDPKDRVRHYRRLAVAARDLAFDLDLAVHAYREVLRVEPEDLPVLGELTTLERRRADMAGLAWALEHRARAAEGLGDKRLAAAALRELGQVLDVRLGRAGDALVALEKAARLFPEPSALLELANLSLRLERAPNARRALEDVLALLPRHAPPDKVAEVRARLGRACELLGDDDAARENYAMAFPLRRLDDELAGRLEALYEQAGAKRELTDLLNARAQALLQAGRGLDASPLFFRSAELLLDAGDRAGAMLRLASALEASPTGEKAARALESMAELELERGEAETAARLYARRGKLEESPREGARWLEKASRLVRGTPREVDLLTQALELDGTFVPARLRRAELTETSNAREAFADLEIVLAADPQDEDVKALPIDRVGLSRKAGFAALRSGHHDAARRLLAVYCAAKPEDVEAQLELVRLHRRAGALEPLTDLLGDLWPRLEGAGRIAARREFAEGALSLGRTSQAVDALRSILTESADDDWAAGKLLSLLPADEVSTPERLTLLGRLVEAASGDTRADLLARRAELHRVRGDLPQARVDLNDAALVSSRPLPILRSLAELARLSKDDAAELSAWAQVLGKAGKDDPVRGDAAERLFVLAANRTAAKDFTRALEAFEALTSLSLPPAEAFDAWFGLAQAAKALGRTRRTEEALWEASRQGPPARRVEALLERAELLEARGEREDAVGALEAARVILPENQAATDGLKRNLEALEDFEGLAEVVAAEAARTPRSAAAPLFAQLARLYLTKLQSPGPAEAALRRVVALETQDVWARRELAALLANKGALPEAVALLEEAAETQGDAGGADILWHGAALAQRAGDAAVALRLMRRGHAVSPSTGERLEQLAEALYLHGAVREALPLQQTLAGAADFDETPELAEATLLRLADLATQLEDDALAEATLRRVVEQRPLAFAAVERLAELVRRRSPAEALALQAKHAGSLSRSPRAAERLLTLAREAAQEVHDVELASTLYRSAAEASAEPLPVRHELLGVLRDAGRTADLVAELGPVAQLELMAGDVDAALAAWDEESRLAFGLGRVDDALRTLKAMTDVCADEGRDDAAAALLLRTAELLRDSKLDLDGAQGALGRAYELVASADTATTAMELARRRSDREGEIDWLERVLEAAPEDSQKADGFLALARLHLGLAHDGGDITAAPLQAPDQAEAALKQALALAPEHAVASALLLGLYERLDRVGDIAAHYEEAARGERDAKARAALLLKAADLYATRAERPHDAAAALLAARAADPDDAVLTARVADSLHALGRAQDAADFDAVLLAANPFHAAYARHLAWLEDAEDLQGVAGLLSRRAEQQTGAESATTWLQAADAFRRAGAVERAQLCEAQAFEAAPGNLQAFETLLARAEGDVRRQAELLAARARAVPVEASGLLRRRATALSDSGEALLAAGAWDDYLAAVPGDAEALEARGTLAADAGGPRAAQPYDRKLLQVAGAALPKATQLTLNLRLGQAALESKAFRDAVDALEAVCTLDATGARGNEALSLLTEAYAQLGDVRGQYFTALRRAQRTGGDEAESLYRHAVSLFDEPEKAIEALDVLVKLRPADEALYRKAVRAYGASGRLGDLVELHERFAEAAGGEASGQALLDAAALLEGELGEPGRAFELKQRALSVSPGDARALEAVLAEQERRGDAAGSAKTLAVLVERAGEGDRANELSLRLATHLEAAGDVEGARRVLSSVRAGGVSATGYAQALESLERLTGAAEDFAAQGDVIAEASALLPTEERAERLLDAAAAFERAEDFTRALEVVRESLATRTSREGFERAAHLGESLGRPEVAADALKHLASLDEGDARGRRLLAAAAAFESAGNTAGVLEALEAVLAEAPTLLSPADAAARFTRLGAVDKALAVGFEPALAGKDFAAARALAEGAGDDERLEQALWAWCADAGDSAAVDTLAARLDSADDIEGLTRLAGVVDDAGDTARGTALWQQLFLQHGAPEALEALEARDALGTTVDAAIAAKDKEALVALVSVASRLSEVRLEALHQALAAASPERKAASLRVVADLRKAAGRFAEAADTLHALVALAQQPRDRAALNVEVGEVYLRQLDDADEAKVAFERALADDGEQVVALRHLVQLYEAGPAQRFAALAERLGALAGEASIERYREPLAAAYEAMGRPKDAYRLLSLLDETPERLVRRAELAQQLGLTGEALSLREKVSTNPAELESILEGYLAAELVPFAVRLGTRLLAAGDLSADAQRTVAERLSPTTQGAELAVRLWPALLAAQPADADGWTLLAEALRNAGREDDAVLADGFGAALTNSEGASPTAPLAQVPSVVDPGGAPVPAGAVHILPATMPRLHQALSETLEALGAGDVPLFLDVTGGVEAWLASKKRLVLGAGALPVFGQAELPFLLALALELGAAGEALCRPGEVEDFADAAVAAFDAVPASWAACRVVAQLDARARGSDPATVDGAALLRTSPAFAAVARRALERLSP